MVLIKSKYNHYLQIILGEFSKQSAVVSEYAK